MKQAFADLRMQFVHPGLGASKQSRVMSQEWKYTAAFRGGSSLQTPGSAIEQALPGYRWVHGFERRRAGYAIRTHGADFDALAGKQGRLEGTALCRAFRHAVAGSLPLEVGAFFQKGSSAVAITRIAQGEGELRVTLRRRQVALEILDERWPRIVLAHRERKELIFPSDRGVRTLGGVPLFQGPALLGLEQSFAFTLELRSEGQLISGMPADWLAGAELVVLEWIPAGRFKTAFEAPDFKTRDASFDRQRLMQGRGYGLVAGPPFVALNRRWGRVRLSGKGCRRGS